MEEILVIINRMRQHFGWDKTDTYEFCLKALNEEVAELNEAETEEQIRGELADVFMYAAALAEIRGYDIKEIIETKADEVMHRQY